MACLCLDALTSFEFVLGEMILRSGWRADGADGEAGRFALPCINSCEGLRWMYDRMMICFGILGALRQGLGLSSAEGKRVPCW